MKKILRAADRIQRWSSQIGFIRSLLFYIRHSFLETPVIPLSVKGISHPLFLRRKTSDVHVLEQVFVDRQYDFDLPGPTPRVIIDAGANTGFSAVNFANRYPEAKIYAIEPEDSNIALLKRNTAPYPNITIYPKALHSANRRDLFIRNASSTEKWGFQTEEALNPGAEQDAQRVSSISLPSIMAEHGLEQIDLLKMDIEGAECALFAEHTEEWLPRTRSLVIELHDRMRPGCSKSVFSAMVRHDFSVQLQGEGLLFILHDGAGGVRHW